MTVAEAKEKLIGRKSHLVAYLLSKFEAEDWHAVQDAASDIREIDAQLECLELNLQPAAPVVQTEGQ